MRGTNTWNLDSGSLINQFMYQFGEWNVSQVISDAEWTRCRNIARTYGSYRFLGYTMVIKCVDAESVLVTYSDEGKTSPNAVTKTKINPRFTYVNDKYDNIVLPANPTDKDLQALTVNFRDRPNGVQWRGKKGVKAFTYRFPKPWSQTGLRTYTRNIPDKPSFWESTTVPLVKPMTITAENNPFVNTTNTFQLDYRIAYPDNHYVIVDDMYQPLFSASMPGYARFEERTALFMKCDVYYYFDLLGLRAQVFD